MRDSFALPIYIPFYSSTAQVQVTVAVLVLPETLNVIVITVPQLLSGTLIVTCSVPPAAMVLLLAVTVTPLMLELADQVSATSLELFVSVIVHWLLPPSWLVEQGDPAASTLVGLAEIVGGAWTTSVTLTVAVSEPIVKVIVSW